MIHVTSRAGVALRLKLDQSAARAACAAWAHERADLQGARGARRDDGPGRLGAARRAVIDLRHLQPPEPLFRIFDAIDGGGDGPFTFLLLREPLPLYPMLALDGWRHQARRCADGCEVTIFRSSP